MNGTGTALNAGTIQKDLDALATGDDWGVRAASLLLSGAEAAGCSDLHISSQRDGVLIRGRREGTLYELARLPLERRDLLVARLKVLAQVPAFVRHEPQDGRIEWCSSPSAPPRLLRASFLPTIHGENVVIRFPEGTTGAVPALHELGMPPDVLDAVEGLLVRREGVLFLTGPSSSGKTTTMYAMLTHLHGRQGDRLNVITIEDPVERDLGFAGQVQVNAAQGLTFERALRAALRQDPNVLMIGEVRDAETARIAVQGGMTGHLVISTLHAGRACLVFTRLLSIGIEPYLVASAVGGAIAQRLVRLVCPGCAGRGRPEEAADGTEPGAGAGAEMMTGACCTRCAGTGTAGRTGIFEVARVTEELRELILAKAPPSAVAARAARHQVGRLEAQAEALVRAGRIAPRELELLFPADDEPHSGLREDS